MRRRHSGKIKKILLLLLCLLIGWGAQERKAEAATLSRKQQEYVNALSEAMVSGVETKNMDKYREVSQGKSGDICMKEAALLNRAAIMAEGIDFLDANWSQYYMVENQNGHVIFHTTKIVSRKKFKERYRKINAGLKKALAGVEPSMSRADQAMAVYIYFAENTVYKNSKDSHTGYDVLTKHTGVCDGLANAYALAMTTLKIPCVVVSNYKKDHSWNLVELNKKWYFVDLTKGVGVGRHDGMVVTYTGFLTGKKTFLRTHSGYKKKDLYGQGNSNDLNLRKINLASSDYIGEHKEMKSAIEGRTCLVYYRKYWYWISQDNRIKRSRLSGNGKKVYYIPPDRKYVGWIRRYKNKLIFSVNSRIYRMDFQKRKPVLIKKVKEMESRRDISGPLWHIIYVGRFKISEKGYLTYYISDFHGVRKGKNKINLRKTGARNDRKSGKKKKRL